MSYDHGENIVYNRWMVVVFVLVVPLSAGLEAQESKPWWQFGKSDKSEMRSRSDTGGTKADSGTAPTGFNLPFSPSRSKTKSQSQTNSAIVRAGKTSKKWWDNTVDFMNPFNDSKPAPARIEQSNSWGSSSKHSVEKNGMGLGAFQDQARPEDRSWFNR